MSIASGDTVESNAFINIIDGVLSLNFGIVDVPAGFDHNIREILLWNIC